MPSSSAVQSLFPAVACVFLLLPLLSPALASESDHKFQANEQVTLWVNKVGPYNNPQETYNYYSLPFCRKNENSVHKWGGLGEVLGGNELIDSQIDIKFLKNVDRSVICHLELDEAKVKQFKDAIENSYWFELFMGMYHIYLYILLRKKYQRNLTCLSNEHCLNELLLRYHHISSILRQC
ncbi:unnamed protein product [Eruca vesicaria subsp. sativa]|uniref:Transmembrane 9 superfamily member n=1 Tax=Eruca vesicaria subsp. sativa TaxID=29727 RepID=A0ABC8LE73_ERUVS|nr:unnamed protein product [Eruca vesicaria subsp. sativa]